jgi:N-acetylmuramoyl-L-alanine amidase
VEALAAQVRAQFQGKQPEVELTPEYSLEGVVSYVNKRSKPGDVLLVLHMNAAEAQSASGVEVVYAHNGPPSRAAQAEKIGRLLAEELGLKFRRALVDLDTPAGKKNGLPILRDTVRPAFLIEFGFITNPADRKRVRERGRKGLARVINNLREILK